MDWYLSQKQQPKTEVSRDLKGVGGMYGRKKQNWGEEDKNYKNRFPYIFGSVWWKKEYYYYMLLQ